MPARPSSDPRPCYSVTEVYKMATAAQTQTAPTPTDPIERWLARRGAVDQLHAETNPKEGRAAVNRANSQHSTGPRTESGKQRSSLNALSHGPVARYLEPGSRARHDHRYPTQRSGGFSAQKALLPTEDPDAYQRHIQQFLDEYAPATPTETQLVHEIANTAWRLNRIPLLEAELFSQNPYPQTLIPMLATLGLHGSRLSRQFQKAVEQLREIQDERRHLERRQLKEAAELLIRHQHKGLSWEPADFGFVFSKQQVERHARQLMLQNPTYYAGKVGPAPRTAADAPPA
jgi:hypothetical protein